MVRPVGDGSSGAYDYNRPYPEDVAGLTSGVVKVEAGFNFTCALLETGGLKCWRQNSAGQLGDGTSIDRTTPVDVLGLTSGVADIARTSGPNACAIMEDTTAQCWGHNYLGQLGNGTAQIPEPPHFNPVPGPVCADATCSEPLTGVVALALGALEARARRRGRGDARLRSEVLGRYRQRRGPYRPQHVRHRDRCVLGGRTEGHRVFHLRCCLARPSRGTARRGDDLRHGQLLGPVGVIAVHYQRPIGRRHKA